MLAAASAARGGDDQGQGTKDKGQILLRRCILDFEQTAVLGAGASGLIQEILVKPGDRVKAGQVLGRLLDNDLRIELALRTAEAENTAEIRLGELKLAQALNRLKASDLLSKRNMISNEELESHRVDAQSAELELQTARHRHHLAQLAQSQVEVMIQSRAFVSPFDGIVVAVLKNKGESVEPNAPVFRLVGPGTLRVSGFLDVGDAWQVRAGQLVRVSPEIPGAELPVELQVFTGRIVYVEPEVSPENQTCKVVALVENRENLLRGGLEARMEIFANNEPEAAPAPPLSRRPSP
jgi:RND family efflux transporter MFP subunit